MKIVLNGNDYELKAGTSVTRSPRILWPQNTRLDGQQLRKDREDLSSWSIDSWSEGLGKKNISTPNTADLNSLWDVENCDTRIDGQVVLSPAFNTCTVNPSRSDLALHFERSGQIYFVETTTVGSVSNDAAGTASIGHIFKFTAPNTIGSFGDLGYLRYLAGNADTVGSISAVRAFGLDIAVIARCAIPSGYEGDTYFKLTNINTNIPTITSPDRSPLGSSCPINVRPQIGDFGGTLHILYPEGAGDTFKFFIGSRALQLPAVGSLFCVPVLSLSALFGTYLPKLETDGLTMFAQTPDGIYDFDPTPAVAIDTSRSRDRNGAMTIFNQKLYFRNKKSIIEYDGTNTKNVGYDLRDGLPVDKLGETTAMTSSWQYLFAAVQGLSYSHILTMDRNNKWEYYARIPTMGVWVRELTLSDLPDGIDRLWCMFGSYGYPGYFLNPMVNPLNTASYSFVPTGYFTKPIYGGDLPEEAGAFFDWSVISDETGGGNKIICQYGLNSNSPVTTLGVVATTNQTMIFGSPYGLEGYRIQPKFMLCASATGTTPVFRQSVIHYLKQPDQREIFDFDIDLEMTSKFTTRPIENILDELGSLSVQRTLMPFWYGQVATKNVKVLNMPNLENVEMQKIYEGERKGFVSVKLAEIL